MSLHLYCLRCGAIFADCNSLVSHAFAVHGSQPARELDRPLPISLVDQWTETLREDAKNG